MTGDPLRHVSPGEPFQPSAAAWNRFTDVARAVDQGRVIFGVPPVAPHGGGTRRVKIKEKLTVDDVDSPVAIYRTSHPDGFQVIDVLPDGTEVGEEFTAYADELVGVHSTDKIVRLEQTGDRWQIITTGAQYWANSTLEEAITTTGGVADGTLWDDGPTVPIAAQWSLPEGTVSEVLFDDRQQKFVAFAPHCAPTGS